MQQPTDPSLTTPESEPASGPEPKRRRPWLRRAFVASQLILGLGIGLVVAEQVFAKRDEGAFPHVNFYVADPVLGVRLEPGAQMKFKLGQNPTTSIQVNAQGYRGADWPAAPGADRAGGAAREEIIVLGDSQVFGLGVEDDETFSARLAAATGRPVLNAGVPTYGPPEYLALAAELLEARAPGTLVLTVNFLNDPFEIDRPNKDRHAVWDGWAVRAEHAPAQVRDYPGRKWLYSQSHAFYAFRRWQHERGKASDPAASGVDFGTPSEGGFEDLVVDSQAAHAAAEAERAAADAALSQQRARIGVVESQLQTKRDDLDYLVIKASDWSFDDFDMAVLRGQPGDIVEEDLGEESRSVVLTAGLIRKAARERDKHLAALQREQARKGKTEVVELLADQDKLAAERAALRLSIAAGAPTLAAPKSVFDDYLRELKALCEAHGTELVVVVLPVDVQVDPSEWDKYGVADRPDMSESLVLLSDLVANAEDLGVKAIDTTEALRGAEPGAFLDGDIHMTAKGHAAVAEALAARLAAPLPVALPGPGLPEGRSFVPTHSLLDEWAGVGEVMVKGSTKAGCTTQIEREWFRVRCRRPYKRKRASYGPVEVLAGATPATMVAHNLDGHSLVTPLTVGTPLTARFHSDQGLLELRVTWPVGEDGEPHFSGEFVEVQAEGDAGGEAAASEPGPALTHLCEADQAVHGEQWCADGDDWGAWDCRDSCRGLWADPDMWDACAAAHAEPRERLACAQHDPLFAPPCPAGSVHAFASNACFAACDAAHPCAAGACTPWQGASVCVDAVDSVGDPR